MHHIFIFTLTLHNIIIVANVVDDQIDRMKPAHKSMKSVQRIKDAGSDELSFGLSGQPKPLSDAPIITKMIDNSLTLLWIPSIPEQPRFPVSYVVEFAKISDGIWTVCHGSELSLFIMIILNLCNKNNNIDLLIQILRIVNVMLLVLNHSKIMVFVFVLKTNSV